MVLTWSWRVHRARQRRLHTRLASLQWHHLLAQCLRLWRLTLSSTSLPSYTTLPRTLSRNWTTLAMKSCIWDLWLTVNRWYVCVAWRAGLIQKKEDLRQGRRFWTNCTIQWSISNPDRCRRRLMVISIVLAAAATIWMARRLESQGRFMSVCLFIYLWDETCIDYLIW